MRLTILFILLLFCSQKAFSQDANHIDGGRFKKIVEQNGVAPGNAERTIIGLYNTDNKSPLAKIFFGLTNSPVEFMINVPSKGQAGLRLFKKWPDSLNWTLEVVPFGDYTEAIMAVKRETEIMEIPLRYLGKLPYEYQEQVNEHNKKAPVAAIMEGTYEPYRPETKTFTILHMGDRLYETIVVLIDNFKGEGIPFVIGGGDSVTFRCVVGDEVWTLSIHEPQKRALQMSNLFRQLIEDVMRGDKFDEWKYVRMLEPIEF